MAHSTGGLIVKKYVMDSANNNEPSFLNKVVFVGVPNLGAPKAFKALINGDGFSVPDLNDQEMKQISQNLPIAYDLAPDAQYGRQVGSFLNKSDPFVSLIDEGKDLDYNSTVAEFENQHLVNSAALANSHALRTADFDNYDIRNNGVDVYNIIGCKTATFGKFTESVQEDGSSVYDFPVDASGDGTVPLLSAQTIPADPDHVFFAPKAEHGKMPSADGIRQQIVNILTGSRLDTDGKILTHDAVQANPKLCEIKGEQIKIKSPVAISVTDQSGNISQVASNGSMQNDIPGADYEVWGDHKYVFLPDDDGQTYNINLTGVGSGTFTLDDQSIDGNNVTQTQVFSNLPVTPSLTGSVNLGSGGPTTLSLRATATSVPVTVMPSSVINANQSADITAPVSTSTITGTMGQIGYYSSNVSVGLSAIDPVAGNNSSQTSGVLNTRYSLDGSGYQAYDQPVVVSSEGIHTVSFFSTDKAGNNEQHQTIVFTIDKTAPELVVRFNPDLEDLQFTATDTLPALLSSTSSLISRPSLKVLDQDDVITATDAAGNRTIMTLQGKGRKNTLKADIKSLTYNGKAADLSANLLHFDWSFDRKGVPQVLTQQVQSKKDYNILAIYMLNKTLLIGKDQTGKINKTLNGLALIKITTNQGDLNWSY